MSQFLSREDYEFQVSRSRECVASKVAAWVRGRPSSMPAIHLLGRVAGDRFVMLQIADAEVRGSEVVFMTDTGALHTVPSDQKLSVVTFD